MRATMTISLPRKVKRELDTLAKQEGLTRSDIVRRSLEDYMFFRRFDAVCAELNAQARAQGMFTEEDVVKRIGHER